MRAAGRQGERPARGDAEQPPLRVERVEERVEVALVRAPAVEEDERGRTTFWRLRGGLADERVDHVRDQEPRGSGSGVSVGSIRSRRCSNAGGSESRSPRCSCSSSVAKPGPIVAISKRTPLGSRK